MKVSILGYGAVGKSLVESCQQTTMIFQFFHQMNILKILEN